MPVSKKPRTKAASRTPPRAAAVPALPDRRAMESYLATIAGRSRNDAIAKAQDVMYDAWERTTSRSRVALARKALGISPLSLRRSVRRTQDRATGSAGRLRHWHCWMRETNGR